LLLFYRPEGFGARREHFLKTPSWRTSVIGGEGFETWDEHSLELFLSAFDVAHIVPTICAPGLEATCLKGYKNFDCAVFAHETQEEFWQKDGIFGKPWISKIAASFEQDCANPTGFRCGELPGWSNDFKEISGISKTTGICAHLHKTKSTHKLNSSGGLNGLPGVGTAEASHDLIVTFYNPPDGNGSQA